LIALLQRVSEARVVVEHQTVGEIARGLLVLLCAERGDTPAQGAALLAKLLGYRVFPDDAGRMNRSLNDLGAPAGLLLVPQFTLAADTGSGTRPGFEPAAPPAVAEPLFGRLATACKDLGVSPGCGVFGADMQVGLVNHGPVTFWLRAAPKA